MADAKDSMNPILPLRFKRNCRTGIIEVAVPTPHGIRYCPTGQVTHQQARDVCDEAMVDKLQMAACAGALSHDVISRLTKGRRFTCKDIFAAWREEQADAIAPATLENYCSLISSWMTHAKCEQMPLTQIKLKALSDWVNERGIAWGSRRNRLGTLRLLFRWAAAAGYCVGNMADRVRIDKRLMFFNEIESERRKPLSPEDYAVLMASPKVTGFWRWSTALGYWLGLRLLDIVHLEWVSLKENSVVLYMRKTGKRLEVGPLDDPLFGGGELRKIFMEITEAATDKGPWCFPEQKAIVETPSRRAMLSVYYKRILERHGIQECSFHSTRHACAVRLKKAGKDLREIGEVLGHSQEHTTAIYANH